LTISAAADLEKMLAREAAFSRPKKAARRLLNLVNFAGPTITRPIVVCGC